MDGGSTGSRLHVFEFVPTDDDSDQQEEEECVRRGSSRANIPLSAFGRLPSEQHLPLNATYVAEHLLPLFEYAAEVIPAQYHASTPVKYQATAGMRLLSLEEQEEVYDALYQGLMEADSFVFRSMQRGDIQTLSGELEGYFGAVAANYLQGIVDAGLKIQSDTHHHHGPVGALDMGGSSTQIVFLPETTSGDTPQECPNDGDSQTCGAPESPSSHLNGDHFFSTSYLSYGVDQFRERLWTTLVAERTKEEEENEDPESCASSFIQNPCANKGFQTEWEGYTLYGTGDTQECIRQTQRLIPHAEIPHDNHEEFENRVGGVDHPPVRGKFLAMSLYFFSLDSLRVFSEPDDEAHKAINLSWPNPSIEELHNALDGLCSRDWHGDMALQEGAHSFTRAEVLPHRCRNSLHGDIAQGWIWLSPILSRHYLYLFSGWK